jgi:small subunit ribosomal protein S3
MGHKVHPNGFRIAVIRDWQAKWYADKHYAEFLQEDLKLRDGIQARYAEAAISQVDIERQANKVSITINTARPGIVIGRGGQRVDETRTFLEKLIGKKVQLNIQEIQRPELDATLVAKQIAEQIERRVAFRRAMKQTMLRTMQAGAKGMRVSSAGRLGGAEIARRLIMHEGQVPLHTMRADIDYGFVEARTTMGKIGIKVWIYKGDVLPEKKEGAAEESVIEPSVEPEAVVAEKIAEPVVVLKVEEKIEESVVEEESAEEEKPVKPARKRKKTTAEAEETAEEQVTETKEKPVKAVAKKKAKTAEEDKEEKVEKKAKKPVAGSAKEEENSATT